jgi:hypothetical protein
MSLILSYKKLDKILDYLREHEVSDSNTIDREPINQADVSNYLLGKFNYKITTKELVRIFTKLTDDGYIYIVNGDCYLTHSGYWFEGYESKALRDANVSLLAQVEIDRRHMLDDHLKNAASRLNRLTLWLSIGSGVLALIELAKILQPAYQYFCNCQFLWQK